MGVEEADLLLVNQRQQPLCFFVGDDELDLHRKRAGQFKKVRLVQHAMSSESCHGLERRLDWRRACPVGCPGNSC
jgi:hypothetical protein